MISESLFRNKNCNLKFNFALCFVIIMISEDFWWLLEESIRRHAETFVRSKKACLVDYVFCFLFFCFVLFFFLTHFGSAALAVICFTICYASLLKSVVASVFISQCSYLQFSTLSLNRKRFLFWSMKQLTGLFFW